MGASLDIIGKVKEKIGADRILPSPSCSELHSPLSLRKSWRISKAGDVIREPTSAWSAEGRAGFVRMMEKGNPVASAPNRRADPLRNECTEGNPLKAHVIQVQAVKAAGALGVGFNESRTMAYRVQAGVRGWICVKCAESR